MTAKNVAIVWAPNLLRSKSIETGGVAALQGVGVQGEITCIQKQSQIWIALSQWIFFLDFEQLTQACFEANSVDLHQLTEFFFWEF